MGVECGASGLLRFPIIPGIITREAFLGMLLQENVPGKVPWKVPQPCSYVVLISKNRFQLKKVSRREIHIYEGKCLVVRLY